jgi:hypothetical protein
MKKSIVRFAGAALLLSASTGCSSTVRYMSATQWTSGGSAATPAAAPAEGATGAAAPASSNTRVFYLTYWEGTCNSGFASFGRGCSLGDSKIRRCNVKPDNSLACVDEAEATKAIARQQ